MYAQYNDRNNSITIITIIIVCIIVVGVPYRRCACTIKTTWTNQLLMYMCENNRISSDYAYITYTHMRYPLLSTEDSENINVIWSSAAIAPPTGHKVAYTPGNINIKTIQSKSQLL